MFTRIEFENFRGFRQLTLEGRITAILSSSRSRAKRTTRAMRVFAAVAMVAAAFFGTCQLTSRAQDSTGHEADVTAATEESNGARTMLVRVLDEAGKQISDAKIHVSIWEMEGVKEYANRHYITDEEGRSEVARPRHLRIMRMWPAKDGHVPLFVNFAEGKHEEGRLIPDEYEFRLQKGRRLSGRIVDEQGNPISKAKVQVRVMVDEPAWGANPDAIISTWLASGGNAAVTDSSGRWSINNAPAPPDKDKKDFEFRLQVTHPDFAGDTQWGELQQQQGITTADLRAGDATLTLDPGVALSGQVIDPEGKPVQNGLVVWSDHPYWAEGVNETQFDESGRFKTRHLAPGEYPITVLAPGFAPWRNTVDVYREIGDLNIQMKPGHPVRIQFVDLEGQPIPGV
jgi:protocatechuate 3,4-dioxygenase beta subunit